MAVRWLPFAVTLGVCQFHIDTPTLIFIPILFTMAFMEGVQKLHHYILNLNDLTILCFSKLRFGILSFCIGHLKNTSYHPIHALMEIEI